MYASLAEIPSDVNLDRISVYLPPAVGMKMLPEIAARGCDELWLNPGSESDELVPQRETAGLERDPGLQHRRHRHVAARVADTPRRCREFSARFLSHVAARIRPDNFPRPGGTNTRSRALRGQSRARSQARATVGSAARLPSAWRPREPRSPS